MPSKLRILCFADVHNTDGSDDPPEMTRIEFPEGVGASPPDIFQCPKCEVEIGVGLVEEETETIQ